jgi:hypothetical protein
MHALVTCGPALLALRQRRCDVRQIRRYEAGEQQPACPVSVAIDDALGISVAELAGKPSHQIQLGGQWWGSWQTSRSGDEKIASQQVEIKQEGELLQVATITRGLSEEEGGYHWSGELRLLVQIQYSPPGRAAGSDRWRVFQDQKNFMLRPRSRLLCMRTALSAASGVTRSAHAPAASCPSARSASTSSWPRSAP